MKNLFLVVLVATAVWLTPSALRGQGQQEPREDARTRLNAGIQAFRQRRLAEATEHFRAATELDPEFTNAQLYLATAYAQQFIPRAPSEENQKFADNAIASFEKVLTREPKNTTAIRGIAGLYQSQLKYQNARDYYRRYAEYDPANAEAYYAIGSIDWYLVYDKNTPLPLAEQATMIAEGIESLNKALALNPDYDKAMTYMNLLLREKARLASDPAEKSRLRAEADEWFDKAMAARKRKAEQRGPGASNAAVVPPPREPATNPTIRIGTEPWAPEILSRVEPVYPPLARQARVAGDVILEVVIDKEGKPTVRRVVSGNPLLNEAAMEAVRQWRYKPATLNGQTIEVITTIVVSFTR